MPAWTIAAAQYELRNRSVAENIANHLRFIDAAVDADCEVLVFPELSLTGPGQSTELPAPPDSALLQPLNDAATRYQMTIIVGLPVMKNNQRIKGIAIFTPGSREPLRCAQGQGACLAPKTCDVQVFGLHDEGNDLDPQVSLLATGQCTDELHQQQSVDHLQRFAHHYAIAVLKSDYANSAPQGGSALWDENGQLIVRADRGELLLTGRKNAQGWQGDIIPLR